MLDRPQDEESEVLESISSPEGSNAGEEYWSLGGGHKAQEKPVDKSMVRGKVRKPAVDGRRLRGRSAKYQSSET